MCVLVGGERQWIWGRCFTQRKGCGTIAPFAPQGFSSGSRQGLFEDTIFSQEADSLVRLHPAKEDHTCEGCGGREIRIGVVATLHVTTESITAVLSRIVDTFSSLADMLRSFQSLIKVTQYAHTVDLRQSRYSVRLRKRYALRVRRTREAPPQCEHYRMAE